MYSTLVIFAFAGLAFANSAAVPSNKGVVFCYYGTWSNSRPGIGRFGVDDIPADLCTHVIYSFLGLDSTGALDIPVEETLGGKSNSIAGLVALREQNPNLKVLAAIGGWNEGSDDFTIVVNNDTIRANFVENIVKYVRENGLDGFDLDWEYPNQRGGVESDKEQFVVLVKELKEAFQPEGFLLAAAVGVTQNHIDLSYNVPALSENLDYISLMLYDLHGSWDGVTGVNAPLFPQLTDNPDFSINVDICVNTWISNGADPAKLVLGIPAYGKSYTLASLENTATGAPINGSAPAGPYLGESGNYAYYEICEDQQNNPGDWSITEVEGNYAYANKDLFWVGYDTPATSFAKGQYAKEKGLAGVMFWAVDLDDFSGVCGVKYPLISQAAAGYNA